MAILCIMILSTIPHEGGVYFNGCIWVGENTGEIYASPKEMP
jgi:hypothetical protein